MRVFYLLVTLVFICTACFAQTGMQDVIYLKNGSIYRGTIMNQLPDKSYNMRIYGDILVNVKAEDVEKVGKEPAVSIPKRPKPIFHYRDKGFFVTGMANFGLEEGFSGIIGYKFGQFGMLGIGAGLEYNPTPIGGPQAFNVAGGYVPVLLYYSGDFLKRRITPFYNIFAGYAFAVITPPLDDEEGFTSGSLTGFQGGFRGGGGIGVKFYTYKHKIDFTLGLNLAVQNAIYWSSSYGAYSSPGFNYPNMVNFTYSSGSIWTFIPTLNFGLSFLK